MTFNKPLVIVIDLDGTIIGDITPQVILYEISCATNDKSLIDKKDLYYKLRNGIIRPHFKRFFRNVQKNCNNIEFFVYTASEKKWANFIIPHIEKCINVKFNRPIFTREDCVVSDNNLELKKCLLHIGKKLSGSLKKKYGKIDINYLYKNTLVIDNYRVYKDNYSGQLLLCPTYSYKCPENIPGMIKQYIYVKYYMIIHVILSKYINYDLNSNYFYFQNIFYKFYLDFLNSITIRNQHELSDKFWHYLEVILVKKQFNTFNEQVVAYLNKKLSEKSSRIEYTF